MSEKRYGGLTLAQIRDAESLSEDIGIWWNATEEMADEIERLRKLIRCEQIEPPFDATDDMTTEFAVELAEAKIERACLMDANEKACKEIESLTSERDGYARTLNDQHKEIERLEADNKDYAGGADEDAARTRALEGENAKLRANGGWGEAAELSSQLAVVRAENAKLRAVAEAAALLLEMPQITEFCEGGDREADDGHCCCQFCQRVSDTADALSCLRDAGMLEGE